MVLFSSISIWLWYFEDIHTVSNILIYEKSEKSSNLHQEKKQSIGEHSTNLPIITVSCISNNSIVSSN